MFTSRFYLLLILLGLAHTASAQEAFYEAAAIPMDSSINISLLSRDSVSLDYYNLYGFQCKLGTEVLQAQFLVPKKLDTYKGKKQAIVKLCRVTTFINSWMGVEGEPMKVDDFIEIAKANGRGKLHMNLDPEMPDPVYTITGTQKNTTAKKD